MVKKKIGVIGAGSWGTALASLAASNGNEVILWSYRSDIVDSINNYNRNAVHLSHYLLSKLISATTDLNDLNKCDYLVLAIPTQKTRGILNQIKDFDNPCFIICNKGIEISTLKLVSEIILDIIPKSQISVISGPNFAEEVIKELPTITSLAVTDNKLSNDIMDIFSRTSFRIYPNQDIIGTQICGAIKNVIAIACGICYGKNLGENAQASLLSRGINEISKLIIAKGGSKDTLLSPAGIGDLSLTCRSITSRNMRYGYEIAVNNNKVNDVLVEGYYTVQSINALAQELKLDMPIAMAVGNIIKNPIQLDQYIAELLNRSLPSAANL